MRQIWTLVLPCLLAAAAFPAAAEQAVAPAEPSVVGKVCAGLFGAGPPFSHRRYSPGAMLLKATSYVRE